MKKIKFLSMAIIMLAIGYILNSCNSSNAQSEHMNITSEENNNPDFKKAPMFEGEASENGKEFIYSLKKALKNGPVVVYFFPSAYTSGCDLQAHTFATMIDDFTKAGATVVGVSGDDLNRLNTFSADPNFCAGKFPIVSDPDGKVGARFGLKMAPAREGATDVRGIEINHGFYPRTTYVIAKNGDIKGVLSSEKDGISPKEHVEKALALVQEMK